MRSASLKFAFALIFLLLAYNYSADLTSGISAYYSEGPTLDAAMRLAHGQNMYRPDIENPPYMVTNYGPVYFLLQWPFLAAFGPSHLFGNIISLLSHLASAYFAGLIAQRLTGSRESRLLTSLLVLASPLVGGWLPLYRVDLLAQALSLAGVYVAIIPPTPLRGGGNLLAALLFAAASYTKLTYTVCGPASVFLFHIFQGQKRRAFIQAGLLGVIGLTLLGVMQWLTQGGYLLNVVTANQIQYSLLRALQNWGTIYPQIFIASLAIPRLWQTKNVPSAARLFAACYLACAAAAAMAAGKVGANWGYFSELQVALALVIGMTCHALDWRVVGQMAVYLYYIYSSPYHHYIRKNHDEIAALKDTISAKPGLVLADDYVGLVVLTGKPLYFESNAMTQLYYKGRWSQDRFVQELKDGKFSMILLGEYPLRKERWTPEMLDAIHQRYHLDRSTRQSEIWLPN